MEIEQAVAVSAHRADQVGSDSNRVADVDAQANPMVERFDRIVDALRSWKITVAGTVVVDRRDHVVLLDLLVQNRQNFGCRRGGDCVHAGGLGVLERVHDVALVLHRDDAPAVEDQSRPLDLLDDFGNLRRC